MQTHSNRSSPNPASRGKQALLHPLATPTSPSNRSHLRATLGQQTGVSPSLLAPGINQLRRVSSRVQLKNKRGVLQQTEQRIFSQVIELLGQIDDLRSNIHLTTQEIRELQITHPHIDELVHFHGYTQRLTPQQCADLEDENLDLQRQIQQIESAHPSSLEEVLKMERQKYQDLKQQLTESKSSNPNNLQEKIGALKNAIAELQNTRRGQVDAQFPEFQQLRLQNEELRQKTIANLRGESSSHLEEQLRTYLARDEQDRITFMEDLKKFKEHYFRVKAENQALKGRLGRQSVMESKENSNVQPRPSKAPSGKSPQMDGPAGKRRHNSKLSEYESHIRMMQNLKA